MDFFVKFPMELREKILIELKVADLINCSMVSSLWRSRVNNDLIWRRHCSLRLFTIKIMEKYKDALFHAYDYNLESTTLEPLCMWRLVYCVNQALMRLWKHDCCVANTFKKTAQPYCLDCDEERLVSGNEDGSVIVWRVKLFNLNWEEDKITLTDVIHCLLTGTPVTTIKLCNNYVLALQKQLVQIYKLEDGHHRLVGAYSYELGESNMNLLDQAIRLGKKFDYWYKECLRNYDVYSIRKLKFLAHKELCFAGLGGSDAVDIWTIEGQPKAYLTGFSKVRNIVEDCGDVFIISGDSPTVVSRYCWSGNEAEKVISVCGFKRIVFGEDYILAIPHPSDMKMTTLWVWNRSYDLVRTKVLTSAIVSAVATTIVVYTENSVVTVWNPKIDVILKTFSVGASVGFMRHAHSSVIVLFVNANLDAWDFLKGRRLSRLYSCLEWSGDFRDLLWLNPTAVIAGGVRNKIQLVQYFYSV